MKVIKAIVIDNNDTDKKSKIQVRMLPYMNDVKDSDLPWLEPYTGGMNSQVDQGIHNVPEVDSIVYINVISELEQDYRYLTSYYVDGFNIYEKWADVEGEIDEISGWSYPQPTYFEFMPDGSAYFKNSETGANGFYHASGSYNIYDDDGNVVTNTKGLGAKIYNDKGSIEISDVGDINLINEKNTLEMLNAGDTTLTTTNNTLTVTDTGDVTVENSAVGNIKLNNSACDVSIGAASVTINGNLEVLI